MAKPLVFSFAGREVPFALEKVDRSRLYGYVDVEALDEKGRRCEMATLASDGRTLIGPGGTGSGMISADGDWLEKSKLRPVDPEGRSIQEVPSSYAAPVPLGKRATVEEYLSHNIRGVYLLHPEGEGAAGLVEEVRKGAIFAFPYSFRGGLEADAGFLLAGPEGALFLCVGEPTKIRFVGLQQAPVEEEAEGAEAAAGEALDFGML